MTTSRTRALVSIAPTMMLTVALGACVSAPARPALVEAHPYTIRFDNDGLDYVHVYLVSDRRQWLLGRVEPGSIARLRIPAPALSWQGSHVRLAVIAGGRLTLWAAREPRAQLSIAQPASEILSRRWSFTQGQLTPVGLAPSPSRR